MKGAFPTPLVAPGEKPAGFRSTILCPGPGPDDKLGSEILLTHSKFAGTAYKQRPQPRITNHHILQSKIK
jgi:hypothetical protein